MIMKMEMMSSNDEDDDDDDDQIIMSSDEDDETMNQNKKDIIIKNLNDCLDEIIDKSKSFEDQIKSIRKVKNLSEYWFSNNWGDKESKYKYIKLKLALISNEIDKKLFEQIFGHTLEKVANKLTNTKRKEENQIIVNNINKNKKKLHEIDKTDPYHDYVIQPTSWRVNSIQAITFILSFNETI